MTDKEQATTRITDEALGQRVKRALDVAAPVPPFDTAYAAAERRLDNRRRPLLLAASAAAVAVLVVVVAPFVDRAPAGQQYVQIAELMGTAGWTAPSDVLLPRHDIDLYRELPDIPKSTKPAEGALL